MARRRVMVMNPDSHNFLKVGEVLVDDSVWLTVELGYGQPVPVAAWEAVDEDKAVRILRQLVRAGWVR
jgi:hypothetical protein